MKPKIDKNIPIKNTNFAFLKYPWDEMEVRDSFAVELDDQNYETGRVRIRQYGIKWSKLHTDGKVKFATRTVFEDNVKKLRVGRVE